MVWCFKPEGTPWSAAVTVATAQAAAVNVSVPAKQRGKAGKAEESGARERAETAGESSVVGAAVLPPETALPTAVVGSKGSVT